ncbi:chromosomal replication initiator DnaA [Parasphingopyxis algicola]|uniref:HdaA/DnaA family protein n=1 Tax=Parasphingopyxis algicola TaxID=2026624 RepID=UPI0015A1DEB2|nr:chromosomal replication initiator DnaA [Parasphingopyxis algicola]QLC24126.1 chromosomal replication initiator DnaA [Parasphingopyxis algicola]
MSQFALPLDWPESGRGDAFIVDASNSEAVRHLEHWSLWPVRTSLLTGPRKSGRSTLGQLFARKSGGRVIDDADLSAEETLFHAWNAAQADRQPLLIIADEPPPRWEIALPDLRTRIAATPKVRIGEPSDQLIETRLQHHFGAQGMAIPQNAIDYLLKRMDRSHYALHHLMETLDRLGFERRSRITLGLVRDAMKELGFIDV